MALTFLWTCASTTLSGTDDKTDGDTTASLINSGSLQAGEGRKGAYALLKPVTFAGGATFTPTGIFPGSVVTPSNTVGCMGVWIRQVGSLHSSGMGNTGFIRFRNAASTHFIYISGPNSQNYGVRMAGTGGNLDTVCTGGVITADNWFFTLMRWDVPNDKHRLEVYDDNLALVDSVEDTTTDLSVYCPNDINLFSIGSWSTSAPGDVYFALPMVSNRYDEPLQHYANFDSYQRYVRNLSAKMYSNGAFQSYEFVELGTGRMKVNANQSVHINTMVEESGAIGKFYANGTYSCPLFIEA